MPSPLLVAHGLYESTGAVRFTRKTSAITLKDNDAIIADTSGGSFVVTLPAIVSVGTQVFINDGDDWSVNNLTVDPNGQKIENWAVNETMILDVGGLSVQFIHDGIKWNVHTQAAAYSGKAVTTDAVQTLTNKTLGDVSVAGNLNYSGTGRRITGDFSNALHASRVLFKTNVLNGNTVVGIVPDGGATVGQLNLYNSSDPNNSSVLMATISATEVSIRSSKNGTGAYLPLTFWTNNIERLRIDTAGNTIPTTTNAYDLGSTTNRWRNIYTQDLNLSNGIGDYTMIEGEEDLFLVNNKNGKHYKFALIQVDPSIVPAKSEAADGA